jgi:acyl carrier protein
MEKDYKERVLSILGKITKKEVDKIDFKGNLKDQLHIDSIQIVELFAALENEFQIELPLQMMTVKTAEEFFELLEHELAGTL